MSRKTSLSTAGQTYRTNLYNDLREEARASSYLLAFAQDTPDLTLKVSPGNPYFGTTLVEFAGGDSPEFTAPTTHPRIDILSINDSGTLVRTAGDEDDSPTAPAVPAGNIPIAQVFNRVDQTSIKDEDDSSNGYIEKDLRPFLSYTPTDIQTFTGDGTWTKPFGAKKVLFQGWSAGASGNVNFASTPQAAGGSGGGYWEHWFNADDLSASETVTVGTGGAAVTASVSTGGNSGGDTTFSTITIKGAEGGEFNAAGRGGHLLVLPSDNGMFAMGTAATRMYSGGGGPASAGSTTTRQGGGSYYGGAGGGGSRSGDGGLGGNSTLGGNGGASDGGTADAGVVPGGGGGGVTADSGELTSGAGGDGRVRITTFF